MNKRTALKVCVAGLGTVGLPTALHISKFFNVVGYDISSEAVEKACSHGILANSGNFPRCDIYVLAVNTRIDKDRFNPSLSAVYDVSDKIAGLKPNALLCVESTVPVGTCRNLAERFDLKHLVHCPHRYWIEDPVNCGVVQPRVLGALNEESLEIGKRFYDLLKVPVHVVSSIEVAEVSKIAENAYRFVQLAFAEELSLICKKLGLSFDVVREACNTKWNVEILEARNGVGGDCLPKDVRYVWRILKSPLLSGAIKADEKYKLAKKRERK